ncbi:MAG: hypothetical protein NWT04_17070, partial [Verrucomicrobiales bacterium]|nr:hypothetical protein [Verrucomicrobiales bacterium]
MATKKTAKKNVPKKRGRPSKYSDALATEICERLSVGQPLAEICRDEHMPLVRSVSHWKANRPEFLSDFARARDEGFDYLAAECLKIADTQIEGKRIKTSKDG